MKKSFVIISTILLYFIINLYGYKSLYTENKDNLLQKTSLMNPIYYEQKEGHVYETLIFKDGSIYINDIDLTEIQDIIVEFVEEPLFIQMKNKPEKPIDKSFFQDRFNQFYTDLILIHQDASQQIKGELPQPKVEWEYYKVFFGANIKVPKALLSEVHNLPYIKIIHENKKVEAFLYDSVPLIRADSVWNQYNTQGDSIVVGIIDTGIDYMHPLLGGGFGPGYKVIDGYDIVNNDDDPMDDYGHGTHVAGIVAADSDSLKGVAPHSLLMAFKVLDSNGHGYDSWVIAGIERAIDPNNDDDYSDKVDIANVSLGGSGYPDDAVSLAVDNAVNIGVVFCISAGNSWGFDTIKSPGTARSAITVGATDKFDEMAPFSSKGPNKKIYSIKPEVVAPGVEIYSLALDNDFATNSGTSMSAPHVAGVCALLKSIYPNWTPSHIKSALMLSAVDLGEHVMVQGSGRIDALKAAETDIFAFPAHLSFGLDDITQDIWTSYDTINVLNQSPALQSFNVLIFGIQPGITLSASPQNFILNTDDSLEVVITLSVNNNVIEPPDTIPATYYGNVFIEGEEDTLRIPWAFVVQSRVLLTFDLPYPHFIITNDKLARSNYQAFQISPYCYELYLPCNIYDLMVYFHISSFVNTVVQEQIDLSSNTELTVNSTEAINHFLFYAVDEQGRLLSTSTNSKINFALLFPEWSYFRLCGFGGFSGWVTSNISNQYRLLSGQFQCDLQSEEVIRVVNHQMLEGIEGPVILILTNSPSDFLSQNIKFKFPPNTQDPYINVGSSSKYVFPDFWIEFLSFSQSTITQITTTPENEWECLLYSTRNPYENIKYGTAIEAQETSSIFDDSSRFYRTMPIYSVSDSIASYVGPVAPNTYLSPDGGIHCFGDGVIYPFFYFIKYGDNIIILPPPNCEFYGSLDEDRCMDTYHSYFNLYDYQNNLLITGSLNEAYDLISNLYLSPEIYKFEAINSSYFVEGFNGNAICTNFFNMSNYDATPPQITSFKVLNSENIPTGKLETNEQATLSFSIIDLIINGFYSWEVGEINIDSTQLFYKEYDTDNWEIIPITFIAEDIYKGLIYSADLSVTTVYDSIAIDLKLEMQDISGNKTIWKMEPAFAVGDFHIIGVDDETPYQTIGLPQLILYHNYPNPFKNNTTITFSLPITLDIEVRIYNIKGERIKAIVLNNLKKGNHQIVWNGKNEYGQLAGNGIYFYELKSKDKSIIGKMLLMK